MFGLLIIISTIMLYKNMHLGLMPILALLLDIYVLDGAYCIVTLHLESGNNLITAMGLFLFDGIGAILAPIAYLKPRSNSVNKYLYYLEWIILGTGTIFALIIVILH